MLRAIAKINKKQVLALLNDAAVMNHHVIVELKHIVQGIQNNNIIGNGGIPRTVYKYTSQELLTSIEISF